MTASLAGRRGPHARQLGIDLRRLGRRHLVIAAVLPIILLGLLAAMLVVRSGTSSTAIGKPAPDFSLVDLEGNPIALSALRGRPVIVNFWASWCVPCADEFPLLREAYERHVDEGLVVVGIVYQDRSQAAAAFMDANGADWVAASDPDGRVAEAYNVLGPPETFLIGRDGRIADRALGQFNAAWLDERLGAIMEE